MSRVAIFIDGAYLNKVLEVGFGRPLIDYQKLSMEMAGGMEILRTYYYNCAPFQSNPPTEEEKSRYSNAMKFFDRLSKQPRYEVRLGRLQKIDDSFKQKGVDIQLAVDLVRLSATSQITHAVLLRGDSDFVPAVKAAKDSGVVVQLYYGKSTFVHDELLLTCDERYEIDQALIDRVAR